MNLDWGRSHTSLKTLMASAWCSTGSRVRGIFRGTVSIPKEGSWGHKEGMGGNTGTTDVSVSTPPHIGQETMGVGSPLHCLDKEAEAC